MRALHFYRSLSTTLGGTARFVPALCRELSSQGCLTTLLTCVPGEQDSSENAGQTKIVVASFTHSELLSSLIGVHNSLSSLIDFTDIVHIHGAWWPSNWVVGRWAIKHRKALLISLHSSFQPWDLNQSLLKQVKKWIAWQLYGRRISEKCKVIHATAFNELEAIKATGLKSEVAVIPIGIDLSEFRDLPIKKVFDKHFPQLSKHRILLFVSRIHPKKGLINLAHAWGKLSPQFPDWHFLIVGPDYNNHWAEVESLFKSYQIENRYTYAGHLAGEARLAVYSASELFVLPTYSENFGIVIAEALLAKVPVITTNETPWEEIVSQKCGWIIQPQQDQLIEALIEAMSLDKDSLKEKGEKGHKFVKNNYSWESVALKMKRLYHWILYGGEKPEFVHSLEGSKRIRLPFKKPQRLI